MHARIFLGVTFTFVAGRWMFVVVQSWLALRLTGSAAQLGLAQALYFAPVVLFSTIGGGLVDRFSPKVVRNLSLLAFTFVILGLVVAVLLGRLTYPLLIVGSVLVGVAEAMDTPARLAQLGTLFPGPQMARGVALSLGAFNLGRIGGAALGGALLASVDVAGTLGVCAAFAAVTVAGAFFLPASDTRPAARGAKAGLRAGIAHVRESSLVTPLALLAAMSVFVMNTPILAPLMAKELAGSPRTMGALLSATGGGAITGSVILAAFAARSAAAQRATILGAAAALSLTVGVLSATHDVLMGSALFFLVGVAQVTFVSATNAVLQMGTAEAYRGRVMALYSLAMNGLTPVGTLLVSTIAERGGLRTACVVAGVLGLASALVAARALLARGSDPAASK